MRQKTDPQLQNGMSPENQQAMIDALSAALIRSSQKQTSFPGEASGPAASSGGHPKTIDLVELFYYVLSKIIFVIIAAVIGAFLMGQQAGKSVPIYTATAKLYIVNPQGASVNIADLQIGNMLSMDYEEVFKTWEVHEMVRSELNLDYSYSYLQAILSVNIPEDTRVLYISVRHPDAQLASDLANAYANAAKTFILQTMSTDEPNIFSAALVPSTASVANPRSYTIRGFLLGTVLALGIIVLRFVLDERPRTPVDIARAADIPTLSVIPLSNAQKKRVFRKRRADP